MKYIWFWIGFEILIISTIVMVPSNTCPHAPGPDSIAYGDPNAAAYEILGVYDYPAGTNIVWELGACDPEGLPMTFSAENGPPALRIDPVDANTAVATWQTSEADIGLHYVNLKVTDTAPPDSDGPKCDIRTIIVFIWRFNEQPQWIGCNSR
jgi:hypothetical protein